MHLCLSSFTQIYNHSPAFFFFDPPPFHAITATYGMPIATPKTAKIAKKVPISLKSLAAPGKANPPSLLILLSRILSCVLVCAAFAVRSKCGTSPAAVPRPKGSCPGPIPPALYAVYPESGGRSSLCAEYGDDDDDDEAPLPEPEPVPVLSSCAALRFALCAPHPPLR